MDISKFRAPRDYSDETNWAEWLAEDGPQTDLRSKEGFSSEAENARTGPATGSSVKPQGHQSTRPQKPHRRAPTSPESIAINISMPRIRRSTLKKAWRRTWPWLAGVMILAGALYGGQWLMSYLSERNQPDQSLTPAETRAAIAFGYKPLVPDTSERSAGEPLPSEPVFLDEKAYTFTDVYRGANITVDQQALPDSFRNDDGQVLRIAENINATEEFSTTLGTVYMYTSPTSGAQRLVLANDKMLMFLQSTTRISIPDWVSYIQNLR